MNPDLEAAARERRVARVSYAGLFALGVAALWQAATLGLWRADGPGAGFVPAIVSGLLAVLCGVALGVERQPPARELDTPSTDAPAADVRRCAVYACAMLAYALVLDWAGFFVATAALLLVLLRGAERLSWVQAVTFTLAALVLCEFVFARWLAVPLPSGRLL